LSWPKENVCEKFEKRKPSEKVAAALKVRETNRKASKSKNQLFAQLAVLWQSYHYEKLEKKSKPVSKKSAASLLEF
jgi:hypothetical protein